MPCGGVLRNVSTWVRRCIAVSLCLLATAGILAWYLFSSSSGCHFPETPKANAQRDARAVRMAAQSWQASRSSTGCPTLDELKRGRYLDPEQRERDAWGTEFGIACVGDDVTASSAGPDRRWKTPDDISVPRASE